MIETIEQAVKAHDKYQVEIKLDYQLLPGAKTHYRISTYFFIPQSLGVNRRTYSKKMFYRDAQNYIRLKTPTLILRDFVENPASPLRLVEAITATENWANDPACKSRLLDSFKFLSAMLKSAIRDHFNLIQKRIAEAPPNSKVNLMIHNLVDEFLVETKKITDAYRSFYATFNLPNVDANIFAAYQLTDESLSLLIEEHAVELFQIVEAYLKKSSKADFKQSLSKRVQAEIKRRKAHGYRSILKEEDDNEEYTYRLSVLKRHASSVLFLSTNIRREGTAWEQIAYAIAAGLSMIFATVVAFYFQLKFGNFTFPFFIALVVGYMFKDRIKESVRGLFAKYLLNGLYDRRIVIKSLDGRHKLGILKEKVSFVHEEDLPKSVLRARNRDHITELDNEGQGEHIILYSKDIVLFADAFKQVFVDMPEITGINDIMRYDIRAYLKKMAEPIQERAYLDNGQLIPVLCHKVYHLNIVSQYTAVASQKEKLYKRSRLVLNQMGIKRVEVDVSVR